MASVINTPHFSMEDQAFIQNYDWEEYMIDDDVGHTSEVRKTESRGDILDPIADNQEEYLRIYFLNIKCLCKWGIERSQDLLEDFEELTHTGVDIHLFQETHLNVQNKKAVRLVQASAKSTWRADHSQNLRVALESCEGDDTSFKKFGGLLSINHNWSYRWTCLTYSTR